MSVVCLDMDKDSHRGRDGMQYLHSFVCSLNDMAIQNSRVQ